MLMRWCAATVVFGAALAGCGSPSLPDAGECPELTAFQSTVLQERAYQISVARELEAIAELDAGFRERWTERRIRELESFRTDYATYARLTTCHVEFMLDMPVPSTTPPAFATRVSDYGTRMLAAMKEGQDAVATRNTSRYRDWVETIDTLTSETQEMLDDALGASR